MRYSLLPQHLAPTELVDGNALLEGGTFLSILLGTIAGSLAVAVEAGTGLASLLLVLCAVGGFVASLFLPSAPAPLERITVAQYGLVSVMSPHDVAPFFPTCLV